MYDKRKFWEVSIVNYWLHYLFSVKINLISQNENKRIYMKYHIFLIPLTTLHKWAMKMIWFNKFYEWIVDHVEWKYFNFLSNTWNIISQVILYCTKLRLSSGIKSSPKQWRVKPDRLALCKYIHGLQLYITDDYIQTFKSGPWNS